ncbi:RpiB/LacA/LacB family sugar-phosphate isomerase [Janibacter terrae]|nr:RpiB/LacA/LacB family sugar-phosphate isomerase [Janibacter terrae]
MRIVVGVYPKLSFEATQSVASGGADRVVLVCGTGSSRPTPQL